MRRSLLSMLSVIVVILLVSGCTGQDGNPQTEVTGREILKINSIDFYPGTQVSPGTQIVVRAEVENVGSEEVIMLIDNDCNPGTNECTLDGDGFLIDYKDEFYEFNSFQRMPSKDCLAINEGSGAFSEEKHKVYGSIPKEAKKGCYIVIPATSTQTFQWKLKSPSNDQISGITDKTTFSFQANYLGLAQTDAHIYFTSPADFAQRTYTRKDMAMAGDNVATKGPIIVNFGTIEPQPIPTEGTWTVTLQISNKGTGIAKIQSLELVLPKESKIMKSSDSESCRYLNAEPTPNENVLTADTKTMDDSGFLHIYGKKTNTISCALTVPKEVAILTPYRFRTTARYQYMIDQSVEVTTKPEEKR